MDWMKWVTWMRWMNSLTWLIWMGRAKWMQWLNRMNWMNWMTLTSRISSLTWVWIKWMNWTKQMRWRKWSGWMHYMNVNALSELSRFECTEWTQRIGWFEWSDWQNNFADSSPNSYQPMAGPRYWHSKSPPQKYSEHDPTFLTIFFLILLDARPPGFYRLRENWDWGCNFSRIECGVFKQLRGWWNFFADRVWWIQ